MPAKKYTIVLLPQGGRRVRQLKIPRFLLVFFSLLVLSGALLLAWVIWDYQTIRKEIPRLVLLEEENKKQRVQLLSLAHKIDKIGTKMIDMKKFDRKLRIMVNLETDDEGTSFLGVGGSDPTLLNPDYTIEKAHRKLVRLMHESLDNLDLEAGIQVDEMAELTKYLENQKAMLASTPSIWPTKGWISSRFGYRISPFTEKKEFHRGLDISNREKTPIIAPADGIVASVGRNDGYGKMLTINHGHGLKTHYAHMSKILVKRGQYVKRGEKIALVGNTGRTTGPHLHYEVHLNGVPVNPRRYILN